MAKPGASALGSPTQRPRHQFPPHNFEIPTTPAHTLPLCSTLEPRQLLTITFQNGFVTVTKLLVSLNNEKRLFKPASVKLVIIDLGAGNDHADVSETSKPVSVTGGDGNDTLNGNALNDTLLGGKGTDRFFFSNE